MPFRKLNGVDLPYEQQVLVYAICKNYETMNRTTQKKILRLCEECGGIYAAALFQLVTSKDDKNVERVAMDHYMAATTLYDIRRRFYEAWWKK